MFFLAGCPLLLRVHDLKTEGLRKTSHEEVKTPVITSFSIIVKINGDDYGTKKKR
jgi:hypothetical protein